MQSVPNEAFVIIIYIPLFLTTPFRHTIVPVIIGSSNSMLMSLLDSEKERDGAA